MRVGLVVLLTLAAGFGVVACAKAVSGTPVAAARPTDPVPPPTTPVGSSSPAPSGTVDQVGEQTTFFLPSHNIACYLDAVESWARCDIHEKTWDVPPDPGCELDYGHAFQVAGDGEAAIVCAGDTVFPADGPVLAYGHGLRAGDVVCVSSESGVRCHSERSGHGFTLARAAYTLF